jgi:hypothetical protein
VGSEAAKKEKELMKEGRKEKKGRKSPACSKIVRKEEGEGQGGRKPPACSNIV